MAEKRSKQLLIKVSQAEHAEIHARAPEGESTSAWIRRLALGQPVPKAPRKRPGRSSALSSVDPVAVRALVQLGNNLNQIARHVNTSELAEKSPEYDKISEALAMISGQLDRVESLIVGSRAR